LIYEDNDFFRIVWQTPILGDAGLRAGKRKNQIEETTGNEY